MMNQLLHALHPNFEALSSHADRGERDGARTRTGVHVARCAHCRQVVHEIRELGVAARTDEARAMTGRPVTWRQDMWARIERGPLERHPSLLRSPITPLAHAAEPEAATSVRLTGYWPRSLRKPARRMVAVAIAALIVTAILLWPFAPSLSASGVSRLSFSPGRPAPGGAVTVRYRAAPRFEGARRLMLLANWIGPSDGSMTQPLALSDSIGSLRPVAGGTYEATVRLPSNFVAARLLVSDSAGENADGDGSEPWIMIGGTRNGRPSLSALLATAELSPAGVNPDPAHPTSQAVDAADSLRRYFPTYPAGWVYARRGRSGGSAIQRMVRYFESAERKYRSFDELLWPRKELDAERLHEMVVFAHAIAEPDEENRWARRLAREHPEDPRAFGDLLGALHQVELQMPPDLADSIRPWFPLLEQTFTASAASGFDRWSSAWWTGGETIAGMAQRYGDSATAARWRERDNVNKSAHFWVGYDHDSTTRTRDESYWRKVVATGCVPPDGKVDVAPHAAAWSWTANCRREHRLAFTYLSTALLMDGNAAEARAMSDSALSIPLGCGQFGFARMARARASLALGDTNSAMHDLATADMAFNPGTLLDSARRWFGARFDEASFRASSGSAQNAYRACQARESRDLKARLERASGAER